MQREKRRKNSTLLFSTKFSLAKKQGLEKQNLESFLEKEEQEERWVKRIAQVFGQWAFLERESIEQKLLERWREMNERNLVMHERNQS